MIAAFLLALAATPSFPTPYLGRWGETPEGCAEGAIHGGLTISADGVADGEMSAELLSLKRKADGSVDVTERWEDDDEREAQIRVNYRLSSDGKRLTVGPAGVTEKQTYLRCGVTP